jgi:opacity protein-like surface antigen
MKEQWMLALLTAAVIAALLPATAAAQSWDLDVYGGWSYSNLSGKRTMLTDGEYKSGFGGGVGGELRLNEDWGWEFGIWYVQKGTQGTLISRTESIGFLPEGDQTFEGSINMDYVEVPILVNVYFPVGERADVRGYLGPTFAFLTRAQAEGTADGVPVDRDVMGMFDDADITVMIGAGGKWKFDRMNVMLDFRWDIGATNILKGEDAQARTNTVLITAGVGIPLHREAE